MADAYTHHVSMDAHGAHQSYRNNYLDLDPNYKNVFGQPLLLRSTGRKNDIKMAQFMYDKMAPIAKAMNPKRLPAAKNANSHFDTTSYQTTHANGGAVMGKIRTSAVSRYLQSWDVHNVFSIGASAASRRGWAPDRHRGGAGLLVCPRYSRAVSEKPAHWCRHKDGER